jgi:type I restriction enzyme S subunit
LAFQRDTVEAQTLQETNAAQARILAAIRDALLPKLLSGEIRVPEAEQAAEEVV